MALESGPYYVPSNKALNKYELSDDRSSDYPDLSQANSTYSLADAALQVHQGRTIGQLAGLIQAAAAAADQKAEGTLATDPAAHGQGQSKRKRSSARRRSADELTGYNGGGFMRPEDVPLPRGYIRVGEEEDASNGLVSFESPSHGRKHKPRDYNTRLRSNRGASTEDAPRSDGDAMSLAIGPTPSPQQPHPDARQAANHAAAVLFRRPLSSTKKPTRPPMSKLFTSLELAPENFLQLQAAAKTFMLDSAHPDRIQCVGQRGSGDLELVKLRLWNCVKEFLESEGNGERFFGEHVLGDEGVARTMIWPAHKNNIIGAMTPLLRRMVTNERQRKYAVETRKTGGTSTSNDEVAVKKKKRQQPGEQDGSVGSPSSSQGNINHHQHQQQRQAVSGVWTFQTDLRLLSHQIRDESNHHQFSDFETNLNLYLPRLRGLRAIAGLSDPEFDLLISVVALYVEITFERGQMEPEDSKARRDGEIARILEKGLSCECDDVWKKHRLTIAQEREAVLRNVIDQLFDLVEHARSHQLACTSSPDEQSKKVPRSTSGPDAMIPLSADGGAAVTVVTTTNSTPPTNRTTT